MEGDESGRAAIIDHANGHAFLRCGHVFYTPNGGHGTVDIPDYQPSDSNVKPKDNHQPQWFIREFGWMPFLPVHFRFVGAALECLSAFPIVHVTNPRPGFQLALPILLRWLTLERALDCVCQAISSADELNPAKTSITSMPPPSSAGYDCVYNTADRARTACRHARYLFRLLGAYTTHLLSADRPQPSPSEEPAWYEPCVKKGITKELLDAIHFSHLSAPPGVVERVGVFRRVFENTDTPSAAWYITRGVPTWYPWGPTEINAMATGPASWKKYLPPPEKIALALPYPEPSYGPDPMYDFIQYTPNLAAGAAQWYMHPETQIRVYQWVASGHSSGRFRHRVSSAMADALLEAYPPTQKCYNREAREWDICTLFDADLSGEAPGTFTEDITADLPPPPSYSITNFLKSRYRFYAPPPTASALPASVIQWERVLKLLGLSKDDNPVGECNESALIVQFMGLEQDIPSPGELWDIAPQCPAHITALPGVLVNSLKHQEHIVFQRDSVGSRVQVLSSEVKLAAPRYLITLADHVNSGVAWSLALTSATDTLQCVRLLSYCSPLTAAEYLINNGITFSTRTCDVTAAASICSSNSATEEFTWSIPTRPANHHFSVEEYEIYESQCCEILTQPQGRAALLSGGFLWCVAKDVLGLQHVLQGPSTQVVRFLVGSRIENPAGEGLGGLWDDWLSRQDISSIAGCYNCESTGGRQSMRSWWPLPLIWKNCPANQGYWTDGCESFYQERLADYRSGKAGPMSVKEWRDYFRGDYKINKKFQKAQEMAAEGRLREMYNLSV